MEKFSKIFGSLVFFLIHKTKMNCEKNFTLKKLEVTPEAFIIHFYYVNIAKKCSKILVFGKTSISG